MAEHTPTTETVRERYWLATIDDTHFPGVEGYADERRAEFDRWLAEVRQDEAERIAAWVTADEPSDTLVRLADSLTLALLADALRRGDHRG